MSEDPAEEIWGAVIPPSVVCCPRAGFSHFFPWLDDVAALLSFFWNVCLPPGQPGCLSCTSLVVFFPLLTLIRIYLCWSLNSSIPGLGKVPACFVSVLCWGCFFPVHFSSPVTSLISLGSCISLTAAPGILNLAWMGVSELPAFLVLQKKKKINFFVQINSHLLLSVMKRRPGQEFRPSPVW